MIKKQQSLVKYLFLVLFFLGFMIVNGTFQQNEHFKKEKILVKVVASHERYLIVRHNNRNYYLARTYYVNNKGVNIGAIIDDVLRLEVTTMPLKPVANFYQFDFNHFLQINNNVNQRLIVTNKDITVIKSKNIRNLVFSYVQSFPRQVRSWTQLLLFGQKNSDNRIIYDTFSKWGIVALIVISGWHINFFFFVLNKMFFF